MRRKLTEREIETLVTVLFWFLLLSIFISLGIFLVCAYVYVFWNVALISSIYFSISLICFFISYVFGELRDFLCNRNDKIDEEEKARQQAQLLEAEERNRAELQIWVSE